MASGFADLRERVAVDLLRWFPKSSYGRLVGACARCPVPRFARRGTYTRFAHRFGIDLSEPEKPLEEYCSLEEFFTRRLRPAARAVAPGAKTAISPVDGVVVQHGVATAGRLLQAKGIDYTLRSLLFDQDRADRFTGGAYATLYLAPRDYHRIHAPLGGAVVGYRHIPGAFFPVNQAAVRRVAGLFARNERLVSYLDTTLGLVAVVKVAATGVGDISVTYDANARTRASRRSCRVDYPEGRLIAKGDELGTFHLGSTVIVLFEPGRAALLPLEIGQRLRMGEPLAERVQTGSDHAAA
jgi:phosphatidylserine decarboxylase